MSEADRDIDWSVTTWEGSRRAMLRRALKLTVRERLEAAEGLADVARRFAEMRARGEFTSASGKPVERGTVVPAVHEPLAAYEKKLERAEKKADPSSGHGR